MFALLAANYSVYARAIPIIAKVVTSTIHQKSKLSPDAFLPNIFEAIVTGPPLSEQEFNSSPLIVDKPGIVVNISYSILFLIN